MQLKADPALANGFNAVGFSQGGQFLRAYVERYNDPPVHNLVTFGGQHMGRGGGDFTGGDKVLFGSPHPFFRGGGHPWLRRGQRLPLQADGRAAELWVLCRVAFVEGWALDPHASGRAGARRAYVPGVKDVSVQAQYFRSTTDYSRYLADNIFLADINNEREDKNYTYKAVGNMPCSAARAVR